MYNNDMGWFWNNKDDEKVDPNTMSEDQLKTKAAQGLKFFWEALKHDGLKMNFDNFLAYIDNLHPTFRKHLGKQIFNAQYAGVDTNSVFTKIGQEANGKLPSDSLSLQIFGDAFITDISSLSMKGKWVFESAISSAASLGSGIIDWVSFITKYKKVILIGGGSIVLLYLSNKMYSTYSKIKK